MTSERAWRSKRARMCSWALSLCLLLLLQACGTPQVTVIRPDPPPPSLSAPCQSGPVIPATDTSLADLLQLIAGREAAAAECRARHRALVQAWPA